LGGATFALFWDRRAGRGSVRFRRENVFPQALRLLDVKSRVCLAIFLQGAIDGFKRGVDAER
jgi:hypothetical protein